MRNTLGWMMIMVISVILPCGLYSLFLFHLNKCKVDGKKVLKAILFLIVGTIVFLTLDAAFFAFGMAHLWILFTMTGLLILTVGFLNIFIPLRIVYIYLTQIKGWSRNLASFALFITTIILGVFVIILWHLITGG